MSKIKKLHDDLRAIYQADIQNAPRQHPLRTPDCPPLTRFVAGLSSEEQAHAADCPYCRNVLARQQRMATAAVVLHFPDAFDIPAPGQMAAKSATDIDLTAGSADGRLEAEFLQDRQGYVLEVRSKDKALEGHVVQYVLCDRDGNEAVEGTFMLQADANDWVAAHVPFDPADLYAPLKGHCSKLELRLLE
jgi:hypothetical protein